MNETEKPHKSKYPSLKSKKIDRPKEKLTEKKS